ncbi:MAG: hypothetical protein LBS17_04745 [Actinomycetes bacterium]|jgi:uncharacterized surface anchored protein|nr:hypothetical protein [Actinomycetes bacterium]
MHKQLTTRTRPPRAPRWRFIATVVVAALVMQALCALPPGLATATGSTATASPIRPQVTPTGNDIRSYFSDPANASITTGMTLTFTDSKGQPVTNPSIDSILDFDVDLSIPAAVTPSIQAGDYYTITLPNTVTVQQGISNVALYDTNGVLYGEFDVVPDSSGATGGHVTIVFSDNVSTAGLVTGSLYFQGSLNASKVTSPGDTTITVPNEDNLTATIDVKPKTASGIEKTGTPNRSINPTEITWTVIINKMMRDVHNIQVTDAFPAHLDTSALTVSLQKVQVDLYGNLVAGSETPVPATDYSVSSTGTVSIPGPTDSAYEITYTTPIDTDAVSQTGGTYSFTNNAQITSTEYPDPLTASATVSTVFGQRLEKVATGSTTQVIPGQSPNKRPVYNWVLRYNYNMSTISATDAYIDDVYDPDAANDTNTQGGHMGFDASSVSVYPVTIDANGNPKRGSTPLPADSYTITQSAGAFRISFPDGVDGTAYDIVYQTYATGNAQRSADGGTYSPPNTNGVIDHNYTVNNTATTGGNTPATSANTVPVKQTQVTKSLSAVDVNDKVLSWTARLNTNRTTQTGLVFSDQLTSTQYLDTASLVVRDMTNSTNLAAGTDYNLLVTPAVNPTQFQVVFIGKYNPTNHDIRITYNSIYDADALTVTPFVNRAQTDWTTAGVSYTATDQASYTPNQPDVDNGTKQGSYNPQTRTITWDVYLGYASTPLKNGLFTDQIVSPSATQQQTYVPMSLHIYHYAVNAQTGAVTKGAELTPAEYALFAITDPTAANNNTITVDFPDIPDPQPSDRYLIEYQTTLSGQLVAETYTNTARLHNDNAVDHQLTASVTPRYGGDMVAKSGTQGKDGYLYWTVLINPAGSTVSDVVVHDVPRTNTQSSQTIQTDTIQVNPGIVAADGTVSADLAHPLTAGSDYTWTYANNAAGQPELTLSLFDGATITQPYVLTFRTALMILNQNATTIHPYNDVTIDSSGSSAMDDDYSSWSQISITHAGGVLSGQLISFTLHKTTDTGVAMDGVIFQLFDSNGNRVDVARTTDANGDIVYTGLVAGTYTVRELSNGNGKWGAYAISDDLASGVSVSVTANGTVTVTNAPGAVRLHKVDAQGRALTGAAFTFQQYRASTWTTSPVGFQSNYIVDDTGCITLTGLLPGTYRFIENTPPTGYVADTTPIVFEIGPDRVLPVLDLYCINTKASITVHKTMNFLAGSLIPPEFTGMEGQPLPGATYTLYDGDPAQTNPLYAPTRSWTATTDSNGTVTFADLSPLDATHDYWLQESYIPDGFASGLPGDLYGPIHVPTATDDSTQITINLDDYLAGPWENFLTDSMVFLRKTDAAGRAVPGARFALYAAGPGGVYSVTPVRTALSNANGYVAFSGLPDGDYRIREIQAAAGYIKNTAPVDFTITGSVATKIILPDAFVNYRGSVQLHKVDQGGEPVAGAEFRLYRAGGSSSAGGTNTGGSGSSDVGRLLGTYTTPDTGLVSVGDLVPGDYWFVESRVPDGYTRDSGTTSSTRYPFTVPTQADGKPATLTLTVTNPLKTRAITPPNTGDAARWFVPTTAVLAAAAGLLFARLRRRLTEPVQ